MAFHKKTVPNIGTTQLVFDNPTFYGNLEKRGAANVGEIANMAMDEIEVVVPRGSIFKQKQDDTHLSNEG